MRRISIILATGFLIFGASVPLAPQSPAAGTQSPPVDSQQILVKARDNIFNPIVIVGIQFNGKPAECFGPRLAQCSIPAELGDNWMKYISAIVLNRSKKVLTCVRVRITLQQPSSSPPRDRFTSFEATSGVVPDNALYTINGQKLNIVQQRPIQLGPGQTTEVSFDVVHTESGFSPRLPDPAHMQPLIDPWDAFFSDGTRWLGPSGYLRPDPQTPGKYNKISYEEFQEAAKLQNPLAP
jgi:hypothetical protein